VPLQVFNGVVALEASRRRRGRRGEECGVMIIKTGFDAGETVRASEFDNIRELLEMLMSEHTPAKHKIKMKTSFGWEPPMNVFETESEFVVIMDISGMDERDISVVTDGNILRISGVRKDLIPPGKKQFHSLEIHVGPFQRLIGIPAPVDTGSLKSHYGNGLLEVRLRKRGDRRPRKIEVE
jgi:HSP20 family protein